MVRSRLIPTEATPVPSPRATPEPSTLIVKKPSKANNLLKDESTTANSSSSSSKNLTRAVPSQVANGFVALPVALQPIVPGLSDVTQHIFMRRKTATSEPMQIVETVFDPVPSASGSNGINKDVDTSRTVFAVNLPYGSTESSIKIGIESLLTARYPAEAATSSSTGNNLSLVGKANGKGKGKGKGKAKMNDLQSSDLLVESIEIIRPRHLRGTTLLEKEGIAHPRDLLRKKEIAELSQQENLSKKQKKALQVHLDEMQVQSSNTDDNTTHPQIHPLFISADITKQEALDHLFPTSSTLKAHITFSSIKAVDLLLMDKPTSSWQMTSWPSEKTSWGDGKRTRDEILYDLARPAADSIKLHVDDWMKAFDQAHPSKAAVRAAADDEADQPKSKRALARETAAKAAKKADFEKKKALKRRRLYDDDYADAEADEDGWITVTAGTGGVRGRSGADDGDDADFIDEDDVQQAELEGFASGKRSVAIARKEFIKEKEREIQEENKRQLAALNAKLGIMDDDETATSGLAALGVGGEEDEDTSRGGGRGRKKKMKKSRGIEMGMYGFARREESKKNLSDLRRRFEEDKRKIAEMKQQKRFRPY